ncbi:MBL fold metallo-hydrolase [Streptosporangium sp. KLBMP 9127]|nr:MBL fold metallo-hydrolase [Streptosporangium sp. KLBMP 9127]
MGPSIRRALTETFPGTSAADFDADPWVLHFHCYLLRDRGGRLVLVDTGIGAADSPASSWAPVPGGLRGELARVGVEPGQIETVVLTHLHSDHASGAVEDGVVAFPNARHVLQRAEIEVASGAVAQQIVRPLEDRLQVVDGEVEVLPGIRVIPAPGHTPGHQVVRVGELVMTGDVVLHPVQLADPKVTYVYDDDPETAAATRIALLDELRAERGMIATAHFPDPFTRVE